MVLWYACTSWALSGLGVVADFVMSMEPVPVVTADHDTCVPVMGVDGFRDCEAAPQRFSGLTGSGIAVSVLDSGLNTTHKGIAHVEG